MAGSAATRPGEHEDPALYLFGDGTRVSFPVPDPPRGSPLRVRKVTLREMFPWKLTTFADSTMMCVVLGIQVIVRSERGMLEEEFDFIVYGDSIIRSCDFGGNQYFTLII